PAGSGKLVIVPSGSIRPISGAAGLVSVNQMFPSPPTRICRGTLDGGSDSSEIAPFGETRPIALIGPWSVNQRFPSAPAAMRNGTAPAFSPALNSVRLPTGSAAASDVATSAATSAKSSNATVRTIVYLPVGVRSPTGPGFSRGSLGPGTKRRLND